MHKKALSFINEVYPNKKPSKFKRKQESQQFEAQFKQLSNQDKINWVEYTFEQAWLHLQNKEPEQAQKNIVDAILKLDQYTLDSGFDHMNFDQNNIHKLIEKSFINNKYLRSSQKQKHQQIFLRLGLDGKTQKQKQIQKKSKLKQQKKKTGFFQSLCGCFRFF